ncbi:hypothetical protein [Caballeronia sp. LZ034LL]|uniref:hypothetical protein n=1 Tax=Caballeronia sp. LZ034LL TaxID=3038567 RepID=UPI00286079CB|nr:hypothetical protein [Caballeronia sp. LZ034LL]MDR5836628.1 hypothetical protein [Caballeronia sp. LZ034LL]
MISEEARRSIGQIVEQAVCARLRARDDAPMEITEADEQQHRAMLPMHALVLTISSLTFRLLFVLHFSDDDATRACYPGAKREQALADVLMEHVNLCCGSINQQLVAHFPDLGMSTPFALSSRCIDFIDELKPDHVWRYALRPGGEAHLAVTACVCAQAPVDFAASAMEEQSDGELELF